MPIPNFKRVTSYAEIAPFVDQYYNYPEFTPSFSERDFEQEFDHANDIISQHLSKVGTVVEGFSGEDFSLSRYVDLNRGIAVVLHGEAAFSPDAVEAVISGLNEIPADYVVRLDAHPAYVCIFKDGRVLGYEPEPGNAVLRRLGFP